MATTLYDASVARFLQGLRAAEGFMQKGRAHCEANNIPLDTVVDMRLIDDMLPFRFQIMSVVQHSLGAVRGCESGEFSPPDMGALDYAGLQNHVTEARKGLEAYKPATINALEGRTVNFKLGANSLPFVAEGFLLSMSLPNFYFHASTAYDMLRIKGAKIGKRDFMGQPQIKQ